MKVYEYISIYNGAVALTTITVVMIVFLTWQMRKRRNKKKLTSKK